MMLGALTIYLLLVAAVAIQRLLELRVASRNTNLLFSFGAEEVAPGHYSAMRVLHTAWLFGCALEAIWRGNPPPLWAAGICLATLFIGQALRLSAMHALGPRWTTRILVVPDLPPVTGGIYRWVRHPNYLGVILEIAALPLIFGGVVTAALFSAANLLLLLRVRIPAEEAALVRVNNYSGYLTGQARFVPQRSNS